MYPPPDIRREGARTAVFTGVGVIAPTGPDLAGFWSALLLGASAPAPISRFDASGLPARIAAEVADTWFLDALDPRVRRTTSRATQLALVAAEAAVADARLGVAALASDRTGVVVGTALGGDADCEQQVGVLLERGPRRVNPLLVAGSGNHPPAIEVARRFGATGANITISSGCPASAQALIQAAHLIHSGELDICLVGGTEAPIIPLVLAGLGRTGELSSSWDDASRASRPFDTSHNGMVLSEGSCFLVLESREFAESRGAKPRAWFRAGGNACDAGGMYGTDTDSRTVARSLRSVLSRANCSPGDLGWVCAHANSLPLFDRKEIDILRYALGEGAALVPISSIKGVLGHPFGASGAFQTAAAILAMESSRLPHTANLDVVAAGCEANHIRESPLERTVGTTLVTSYGYGGIAAFVLLSSCP